MVLGDPVKRDEQVCEKSAILGRDRPLMALKSKLVLLLTSDVPGLGHIFRVLTHAPAGDAVLHFGNEKPDVGRAQLSKKSDPLCGGARLNNATQPVRQVLSQSDLDTAHAFDAAHQCKR